MMSAMPPRRPAFRLKAAAPAVGVGVREVEVVESVAVVDDAPPGVVVEAGGATVVVSVELWATDVRGLVYCGVSEVTETGGMTTEELVPGSP